MGGRIFPRRVRHEVVAGSRNLTVGAIERADQGGEPGMKVEQVIRMKRSKFSEEQIGYATAPGGVRPSATSAGS
jgi:hypothetical protein